MSEYLFRLSLVEPHNVSKAGSRLKATKLEFPILNGMSLYRLTLNPKGIREPHWHANADELGYCLSGKAYVSIYENGNERQTFLVETGDAFFIPSGSLHGIEQIGEVPAEFVLQFSHDQPEDFSLSSTFGMFTDEVLGNTWETSAVTFKGMTRSTKEVFAVSRTNALAIPDGSMNSSPNRFHLDASEPLVKKEGGEARVAKKNVWPILHRQALYTLKLTTTGMREPHWHPETAELGYVKTGQGRMSVMSSDGSVDTYQMQEGDVYFIPKAYPHHIENLGTNPLEIAIFFDQPMPGDIGFTASVRSFSDEVICPVLGVSADFFEKLPIYAEDAFIVKKLN
jgi:oxalate decarboxylase